MASHIATKLGAREVSRPEVEAVGTEFRAWDISATEEEQFNADRTVSSDSQSLTTPIQKAGRFRSGCVPLWYLSVPPIGFRRVPLPVTTSRLRYLAERPVGFRRVPLPVATSRRLRALADLFKKI